MSLSFFKRNTSPPQTHWLDQNELRELQALAEKIKPSATLNDKQHAQNAGQLNSRNLGSGSDYAESRPYQMGDDPRTINWRLTARSQETFVKTYYADSRPSLTIILDQCRSMIFGTRKRLKISQALRVALLLSNASNLHALDFKAWIVNDHSLSVFDNTDDFVIKANQSELIQKKPSAMTNDTSVDVNDALKAIAPQLTRGSLCYLISDFSGIQKNQLSVLADHCNVQAIHILDPAEVGLKNMGSLLLEDRRGTALTIETNNEAQRLSFMHKIQSIADSRKKAIIGSDIQYTRIMTDEDNIPTRIDLPIKSGL